MACEYYELRISVNPKISEILTNICFENLSCDGVVLAEEEYKDDLVLVNTTEDTLKVYLTDVKNVDEVLFQNKKLLLERGLLEDDLGSWVYEIEKIENQDWSKKWKENWDVTHVSERIAVVPSWLSYIPQAEEIIITLDPGTAFGTGTHPTTQLCMRAIERHMPNGAKMADIGMGSGILAICAAKFGANYVYGCDNDGLVIDTAQENAESNHVDSKCNFECNTADKVNEKFDFIAANILHNVLSDIMGDLKALMNQGAMMVLSGILEEKKQVVLDAIQKHGLTLIEESHQDIWVGLVVQE